MKIILLLNFTMDYKLHFYIRKTVEEMYINFISIITLIGVLYLSNSCVSVDIGAMDALENHIEKQQDNNNFSGGSDNYLYI